MENKNGGGKRWSPDDGAGDLVRAFTGARRVIRSDHRFNILADVGTILGDHDKFEVDIHKLVVERVKALGYTMYTVHIDDGLVFDAVYDKDGLTFGECLPGEWQGVVEHIAQLMKPARRLNSGLVAA